MPLNQADDWLHFVLGLGMIGLGIARGCGRTAVRAPFEAQPVRINRRGHHSAPVAINLVTNLAQ